VRNQQTVIEEAIPARRGARFPLIGFVRTLVTKKPLGSFGALLVIVMITLAIFSDLIVPYHYTKAFIFSELQGPSREHIFGTDNIGRDLFTRVVYGARVSMQVGVMVVIFATMVSIFIGGTGGYFGGWWDLILLRFVDGWIAIPLLLIALVFVGILGPGILNVVTILSVAFGIQQSRILRSGVISIKEAQYIEASRAIGCSHLRIFFRHILPNVMPIIIVLMSAALGGVILVEASLSFLGYGIPPPQPSWGGMLTGGGMAYMELNPWIAVWPGLFLSLTVFGANMFGDALRDLLDPRLRGSR